MKIRYVVAALAAACLSVRAASAQEVAPVADTTSGWFSQEGSLELNWDHISDGGGADVVSAKGSYAPTLRVHGGLTVQALVTLWPLEPATSDSAFEGEGAFVEELKVHYAGEGFSLYAGKFDPAFGSAFDLTPGIYSVEIGQTYQAVEKIGVGGDVDLAASLGLGGEHVLSAAVFTSDRTQLSGAIGTRRPRLRLADGGPANTQGLESFAVSLDGALPNGLGYSLGYSDFAAGLPGEADQRSAVVGMNFTGALTKMMETDLLAEVVAVDGADGVEGAKRNYYTVAGTLRREAWHGSAIVSGFSDNDVAGGVDLGQLEFSLGRDFDAGFTLDAGVKFVDEDGDRSTVFGLRLTFGFGG
jgi:hypothetical protein